MVFLSSRGVAGTRAEGGTSGTARVPAGCGPGLETGRLLGASGRSALPPEDAPGSGRLDRVTPWPFRLPLRERCLAARHDGVKKSKRPIGYRDRDWHDAPVFRGVPQGFDLQCQLDDLIENGRRLCQQLPECRVDRLLPSGVVAFGLAHELALGDLKATFEKPDPEDEGVLLPIEAFIAPPRWCTVPVRPGYQLADACTPRYLW